MYAFIYYTGAKCFLIWEFMNMVSLVAQLVKNPPVMQETLVQFLSQEDALEKR